MERKMFNSVFKPYKLVERVSMIDYNLNILTIASKVASNEMVRSTVSYPGIPSDIVILIKERELKALSLSQAKMHKELISRNERIRMLESDICHFCNMYGTRSPCLDDICDDDERISPIGFNITENPPAFIDDVVDEDFSEAFDSQAISSRSSLCYDYSKDQCNSISVSDSFFSPAKLFTKSIKEFGNLVYGRLYDTIAKCELENTPYMMGLEYHKIASEELEKNTFLKSEIAEFAQRNDNYHINAKLDNFLYGVNPKVFNIPQNLVSVMFDLGKVTQRAQTWTNYCDGCVSVTSKNQKKNSAINHSLDAICKIANEFLFSQPGFAIDNFKHTVKKKVVYDVMDGMMKKMASLDNEITGYPILGYIIPKNTSVFHSSLSFRFSDLYSEFFGFSYDLS